MDPVEAMIERRAKELAAKKQRRDEAMKPVYTAVGFLGVGGCLWLSLFLINSIADQVKDLVALFGF